MQGYDDINGFTLKTGMKNYKILSEYNADNALTKWSVIEKINGLAVADATPPQITGTAEFNNIPAPRINIPEPVHVQQDFNPLPQTSPAGVEAHIQHPPAPPARSVVRNVMSAEGTTFSEHEKERFGMLFKREISQQANNQQAQPQRELQLSTLFDRIASCR